MKNSALRGFNIRFVEDLVNAVKDKKKLTEIVYRMRKSSDCILNCNSMMKEKIIPYQSSSKLVFIILGIVLMLWSVVFSIFLIAQGAWPVSIFLGAEYLVIVFLIQKYFKAKNINDQVDINEKKISIKKFKGDKLFYSSEFSTYWSKVFFTKQKNKSKLLIRESDKETEVASFLHADLKETLYEKIKKNISSYS